MVHVLIADNDLDSHELVDDVVDMIFRDVRIDRALSKESLFLRLGASGNNYDLIIFNYTMEKKEIEEVIQYITATRPELLPSIFFITSDKQHKEIPAQFPVLTRPYSLDAFSEIAKKICGIR